MENSKKIIKVGVIGLGGISKNHLFSLSLIENNRKIWNKEKRVKLVAICDIDPKKLEETQKIFPVEKTSTDPFDIIQDEEIDAIYVLTPTKFHKEYVISAAENGKHVFVEKPIALTVEDIDEMITAREKNGVKIQCGLVFRSAPVIEYLKYYFEENKEKLGIPLNISFRDSQWKPYIGDQDAHGGSTWRKDKEMAHGGNLFEHVIHDIDGMVYLFGNPKSVYSKTRFIAGYEDIEDSVSAIIEFENINASITAMWNNIEFDERRMEIYFENAYIFLAVKDKDIDIRIKYLKEEEIKLNLDICEEYFKKSIKKPDLKTEIPGPYYYESIRFFDSIFDDIDAYPSLEIGKNAQIIIEKIYLSSRENRPILL